MVVPVPALWAPHAEALPPARRQTVRLPHLLSPELREPGLRSLGPFPGAGTNDQGSLGRFRIYDGPVPPEAKRDVASDL